MSREKIPAETPRKPPAEAAKPSGSFLAKPSFQRRRGRAARVGKAKPKSRGNHRKASARTNTPRELPAGEECAGTAGPRRPLSGRPGRWPEAAKPPGGPGAGRDTGWRAAGGVRRGAACPVETAGRRRKKTPAETPRELPDGEPPDQNPAGTTRRGGEAE